MKNKGVKMPWDKSKFPSKRYKREDNKARAKAFIKAIIAKGVTVSRESEDDTQSQMSNASTT